MSSDIIIDSIIPGTSIYLKSRFFCNLVIDDNKSRDWLFENLGETENNCYKINNEVDYVLLATKLYDMDTVVKWYADIGRPFPSPDGYDSVSMANTINVLAPWNNLHNYRTMLNNNKVDIIKQFANIAPNALAVELGVYMGGITRMLLDIGMDVFSFDTFEGIAGSGDFDIHKNGEFESGDIYDYIQGATVVKGELPGTLSGMISGIGFAHFDLDVYKPTKDSLDIIWPLMANNGIIIFDDYGGWTTSGVTKAVDEFKEGRKIYLPTGQLVLMK